jgi:CO/xanthine dehydrogenase FAD-binding subunit
MRPFVFEKVRTVEEAIKAAAAGARYIAGGTTLIDLMREEVEKPERLVDINALPLGGIRVEGSDLVIGALARMAEVAAHPETQRLQPLIAESLIEGASPQLRNMASIACVVPISACSMRPATSANRVRAARRSVVSTPAMQSWERVIIASPLTLQISPWRSSRSTPRCASGVR